jgi:hypothetical protein
MKGNPRRFNFDLSCAAVLQKYDLDRDESARKFHAAVMGAEFKDDAPKTGKPIASNGQKRTMTKDDIMRNYAKIDG